MLSGGSMHNRRLKDRIRELLEKRGFRVYTHKRVPAGDGGLSLGQLAAAAALAGDTAAALRAGPDADVKK